MKLLFFGDSLTKGQVGVSFINLLAKKHPTFQLVNRGTNGDTLNVITQKLLDNLKQTTDYDFIVMQGGGNDLLLPLFKARGGLFAFAYNAQIKKGLVPLLSPDDYYTALKDAFQKIRLLYKGNIIFLTMTCLNEKLETDLNKKRLAFNQELRKIAGEENILLADIEPLFDAYLKTKPQTDYLIENFWAVTVGDRLYSRFKNGAQHLSKKRKLHLTIDGAHVNKVGAEIIADCVSAIICSKREPSTEKANRAFFDAR